MTYTSNMPYPYWSSNPGTYLPYTYRNAMPDDPSRAGDGTLVRDVLDGAIYVLAGGARFRFNDVPELQRTGYPLAFSDYPHDVLAVLPTVPRNGTLLRDPGPGTVVVVVGGAQYAFADPAELASCGYTQPAVNVPGRFITAMPAVPHDNTLLRDPADGAVYVVAGGAKIRFTSPQELIDAGYSWTAWNVPGRHL